MNFYHQLNEETTGLVPTGAHPFGDWLTVQEAVTYCLSHGLNRTPKTIRKWAQRSQNPISGSAEINVKSQDTENGFRWLIEKASLDVKIAQELEFETRKNGFADNTDLSELVATSANLSTPVQVNEPAEELVGTSENASAQVPTGAHPFGDDMIEFLKKQIDIKDQQIAVKDQQIGAMLERDRETNVLIQGLQTSLTQVVHALPHPKRDEGHSHLHDVRG